MTLFDIFMTVVGIILIGLIEPEMLPPRDDFRD